MRLLISFAALFLSVLLLQVSSGGVAPLDALSGLKLDFTTTQIGLLGSAHFVGFFIGCWWAPRLMGSVGPSRAFAAFTGFGGIGLLAHMLVIDAYAWAVMRVATGLCVAGCYTVIEAWIMAKVTNANRGRALGVYRGIDMTGSLAAQLMIGVLAPASYVSYNILALLCCASLLPLTLTTVSPPKTKAAPRLAPRLALARSPLGVLGAMVAGLTTGSFRMIGPVYGDGVGLTPAQIGWFLAAFVAGGAVAQYPAGWLADRFDRRRVLIGLSAAAIAASGVMSLIGQSGPAAIMTASALFGFATFPIYSVSCAHAHDFATTEERVELSAALLFYYALGAIASPLVASALIGAFGPPAMFAMIALGHVGLIAYGLARMAAGRTRRTQTKYVYAPRTSFTLGRMTRRIREAESTPAPKTAPESTVENPEQSSKS
ncbi:MFS transporter [Alphaproteobacteria bacterium KMM 3653]|uniref:MFS transporter n=1 Tax=Harenicola maris TaxID=2841044 RepID=A0AAP2G5A4_9RHOB|nr:MFS transporter [Harenicola maris]